MVFQFVFLKFQLELSDSFLTHSFTKMSHVHLPRLVKTEQLYKTHSTHNKREEISEVKILMKRKSCYRQYYPQNFLCWSIHLSFISCIMVSGSMLFRGAGISKILGGTQNFVLGIISPLIRIGLTYLAKNGGYQSQRP